MITFTIKPSRKYPDSFYCFKKGFLFKKQVVAEFRSLGDTLPALLRTVKHLTQGAQYVINYENYYGDFIKQDYFDGESKVTYTRKVIR